MDFSANTIQGSMQNIINFPYDTYDKLVDAIEKKEISIPINIVTMFEVSKLKSTIPWKIFVFANILPAITIIIAIFSRKGPLCWFSLLAIPIGFGLFLPSIKKHSVF